jgi:MFS family permease
MQGSLAKRAANFWIYVSSETIVSFAFGLFGPFFVVFVQDFGGRSFATFGYAFAINVFAQSIVAYLVGGLIDRHGSKPFMIGAQLLSAVVIVLYTVIDSMVQLYILQALSGAIFAVDGVAGGAFFGDTTTRGARGSARGKMNAITGIASAGAIGGGGLLVGFVGIEAIFYMVAGLFVVSPAVLIFIKEER